MILVACAQRGRGASLILTSLNLTQLARRGCSAGAHAGPRCSSRQRLRWSVALREQACKRLTAAVTSTRPMVPLQLPLCMRPTPLLAIGIWAVRSQHVARCVPLGVGPAAQCNQPQAKRQARRVCAAHVLVSTYVGT